MSSFFFNDHFCGHALMPYSCDICNFTTYSKVEKLAHCCEIKSYETARILKKCRNCNFKSFSSVWRYFHSKKCNFKIPKSMEEDLMYYNTNKNILGEYTDVEFERWSQFKSPKSTSIFEDQTNSLALFRQLSFFFECDKCSYKSLNHSDVIVHFAQKHVKMDSNKKFKCSQCHHKTSNKYSLGLHIVYKHTPEEFINWHKCHLCIFKSKYHHGLKHHLQTAHPGKRKPSFRCEQCDYMTHYKVSLIKHIKRKHSSVIPKSNDNLKLNIESFEAIHKMNDHILQIHEDTPRNRDFLKNDKTHNQLVNNDVDNLVTSKHDAVTSKTTKKPVSELPYMGNFIIIELFQCTYCDVHVTSKGRLHIHVLTEHSIDEDIINVT